MSTITFLSTSAPEEQGIPSGAFTNFLDAVEREIRDLHSVILLRHGKVVAEGYWEPYGPDSPHMLFSLSKSFTSTAIGMLVADGRLTVDDRVLDFFPDEAPPAPSENLKAMRVRDLLTMTTGHDPEPLRIGLNPGRNWAEAFLAHPVEFTPGTHFVYNSLATYMLSAIAQRLSGQRLVHYLQPRLFEPLGIEGATWDTSPQGIDVGGWGLKIRTRDIARFGQLYLQKGEWHGQRLIPETWVNEATSRQVPNGPSENADWEQGYGYQFWRCRHGAYRGDGAFGQFCVVFPEQDAVLAITAGVGTMQAVLDLVWAHLLPVMGKADLPSDLLAASTLEKRLGSLQLAPVAGRAGTARAAELAGRTFAIASNPQRIEAIRFDFADDGCNIAIRDDRGEQTVRTAYRGWARGEATAFQVRDVPVTRVLPNRLAASSAWVDDSTFVVNLTWFETPFRQTLTCHFDGNRLRIDQAMNVAFAPVELPTLEGS
jgi:CubicO group peptidase (beta-lactamase class C family)